MISPITLIILAIIIYLIVKFVKEYGPIAQKVQQISDAMDKASDYKKKGGDIVNKVKEKARKYRKKGSKIIDKVRNYGRKEGNVMEILDEALTNSTNNVAQNNDAQTEATEAEQKSVPKREKMTKTASLKPKREKTSETLSVKPQRQKRATTGSVKSTKIPGKQRKVRKVTVGTRKSRTSRKTKKTFDENTQSSEQNKPSSSLLAKMSKLWDEDESVDQKSSLRPKKVKSKVKSGQKTLDTKKQGGNSTQRTKRYRTEKVNDEPNNKETKRGKSNYSDNFECIYEKCVLIGHTKEEFVKCAEKCMDEYSEKGDELEKN